ncbi:hypothetical protein KAZ01_03640 [Candidatus Gracilibacteria bacterium]|nr:hypothetical protein [Candidatus Gracilibacteria bacterium]
MNFLTAKNILEAYKNARKSRKNKYEVYLFDQNREERLFKMLDELKKKKYVHSEYKKLILNDSKKRYISSPIFQDHILHHLVYNCIYTTLDNKMVFSSFACRKGYGLHKGVLYLQKIIQKKQSEIKEYKQYYISKDNQIYYLKIDFSKYFFSINHTYLKEKIRKYIFDEDLLYVIDLIIDSYITDKLYDNILKKHEFYIGESNKGLPIGGILSQLFANFYLNDFDQYLKHKLKVLFVRYMDDVIIIGTKNEIKKQKQNMFDFLLKEKLILHPNKISFHPILNGVKFTGYVIKNNQIYAGKRIKSSFQKFMDKTENLDFQKLNLRLEDRKSIISKYFSRTGCFNITNFGNNYLKQRGIIDFIRGANWNNTSNAGVFTLNLNGNAGNTNNNVGFRCAK